MLILVRYLRFDYAILFLRQICIRCKEHASHDEYTVLTFYGGENTCLDPRFTDYVFLPSRCMTCRLQASIDMDSTNIQINPHAFTGNLAYSCYISGTFPISRVQVSMVDNGDCLMSLDGL